MTNFFLNRQKTLFFINLIDLEKKKRKMYELRKECAISDTHSKMILKSLKHFNLIDDYYYDKEINSYVTKYSKEGLKFREKLLEMKDILEKTSIWGVESA
jgi:hypothetical protein